MTAPTDRDDSGPKLRLVYDDSERRARIRRMVEQIAAEVMAEDEEKKARRGDHLTVV